MPIRPFALTAGAILGMSVLFPAMANATPAERPGDTPLVLAHRGASAYAPENTLAAVDKAAELGIRWVENDVQRTRDGELIVMHDTTLDRTTDVEEVFPDRAPWNVSDFSAAEVARLDAGSWFSDSYAGARVPTLRQYLRKVGANHQKLLLEIKRPALYPGIEADTLEELGNEGWLGRGHVRSKLVIQSFDAESVSAVHSLKPAVKTGFLGTPAVGELREYARFTDQINPNYATVTQEYVDAVHAVKGVHGKPLEVFTWTVNDAPTARAMAETGVDGIITNYPDVVRDAMAHESQDDLVPDRF
ncbi:glycerophosphodiester phosphodiesterase [Streptomyces sp. N2-109]|uniref:Glycerophosphodiester phosphodiesterase n=1 Tax=Streptomyces gossypii TaxID=2883101 RepID=A0ABT2K1M7_9ACTN|nr:glycerophosphodiester phosphodiesterase family protein [Streptomyces gossypii]MCT2593891.1 glycerophosphodiester phosphodiesterase [Streptomyces gossypii]